MMAVALSLGFAMLDEWHQAHVPGRFASVLDWVADAVGTALAVPLVAVVTQLRRSWRRDRRSE
jgi:VanZ family protein